MKEYIFFIYILLFCFVITINTQKYLKYPFTIQNFDLNKLNNYSDNIFEDLTKLDFYITLKVGKPVQNVRMSINIEYPFIYIANSSLSFGTYNNNKSTTYKELNRLSFGSHYYREGFNSTEIFSLEGYDEKFQDRNLYFILTTVPDLKNEKRQGVLGLVIHDNYKKSMSFIEQLKTSNILNDYIFFLDFKNDWSGDLVIGEKPHNIYKKRFVESAYEEIKNNDQYILSIEKIVLGTTEMENKIRSSLNFNYGFIDINSEVRTLLFEVFFRKRLIAGYCNEISMDNVYYYSCLDDDSKVNYSDFLTLTFYVNQLNYAFSFTYNDIFMKIGDRRICLLAYTNVVRPIKLGRPFLRKYLLTFNLNSSNIGHYSYEENECKESKESEDSHNNSEDKSNKKSKRFSNKLAVIFIIIFSCVVLLLVIAFVLYYLKNKKYSKRLSQNEDLLKTDSLGINE